MAAVTLRNTSIVGVDDVKSLLSAVSTKFRRLFSSWLQSLMLLISISATVFQEIFSFTSSNSSNEHFQQQIRYFGLLNCTDIIPNSAVAIDPLIVFNCRLLVATISKFEPIDLDC